jgi:hypothetical protein
VSDEHYGKILHSFWTDPRIKRGLSKDGKLLLAYYFSSPHKNMSGVFYCPISSASDETGIDPKAMKTLLTALKDFVTFDADTDEVFVHGLAEQAIGLDLKAGDTKRKSIERHLNAVHSHRLLHLFQQRYAHWGLRVPTRELRQAVSDTPSDAPPDAPSDTRAVAVAVDDQETSRTEQGDRRQPNRQSVTEDEQAVIDHYRSVHPKRLRAVPDKTLRLLRNALKSYTVTDLSRAIDGNAESQFHRDNNHMGLELILRDAEKIDYFMAIYGRTEDRSDEFGRMVKQRRDDSGNWREVVA